MKKIISVLLAVALIAAMSVTVFAATPAAQTIQELSGTATGQVDVKIAKNAEQDITKVYYVDVTWDSLDFTYTFNKSKTNTWQPGSHTYTEEGNANANWDKTSATVTVTNHSNAAVVVSAAAPTAMNGVSVAVTDPVNLPSAVGKATDAADLKGTFTVSVSGVPTVESDFTIGNVTLTISDPAASGT